MPLGWPAQALRCSVTCMCPFKKICVHGECALLAAGLLDSHKQLLTGVCAPELLACNTNARALVAAVGPPGIPVHVSELAWKRVLGAMQRHRPTTLIMEECPGCQPGVVSHYFVPYHRAAPR